MASEAGDMKLLGNFRKLIDQVSAEPNYQPANAIITTAGLEAHYTAARAAVDGVSTNMAPNKVAINERQAAFDQLPGLVRRSRNMLKASGASKDIIADAETLVRKLTGARKSPKIKDDPNTPASEATKQNSASQMSFDNQLGNFGAYVSILANVPSYKPNEADLKLTALKAVSADLEAKTNAVSSTFVPLTQARGVRDQLLYLNEESVVNRALLAKAYAAGALGTGSQLYKQIKGLKFKRNPK